MPDEPNESEETTEQTDPSEDVDLSALSALGIEVDEAVRDNPTVRSALGKVSAKVKEVEEQAKELAKRGYQHDMVMRVINNPEFQKFLELQDSGKLGETLAGSGESDDSPSDEDLDSLDEGTRKVFEKLGGRVKQAEAVAAAAVEKAILAELSIFQSNHPDWSVHKDEMLALLRKEPDLGFEGAYRRVKSFGAIDENRKLRDEITSLKHQLAKSSTTENGSNVSDTQPSGKSRVMGRSYAEIARNSLKRQGLS